MPGNRAIGYGEEIDYAVVEVTAVAENSLARVGERLVCATALLDDFKAQARIEALTAVARLKGAELPGTLTAHPLRGNGSHYDRQVGRASRRGRGVQYV